ncbi:MAG TPA: Smr/MutS family protein [Candidatus Eisenbacteria bacterium]|nr:Smr/MutS family protein [Candidatus Eisenbacteria bacterium]
MANKGAIREINVKASMPTVDEARRHLLDELAAAKSGGVRILKVIHGYGSSGVGGKLRGALRRSLALRKKEGGIKNFIAGEEWSLFNEEARALCDRYPVLRDDPDYSRENPGITIVEL